MGSTAAHGTLEQDAAPASGAVRASAAPALSLAQPDLRLGGPAQVLALQRTIGNAAVGRLLRAERSAPPGPPPSAAPARVLQRYAHADCSEDDLKKCIWPSDYVARKMVKKAIKALSAPTRDPQLKPLFKKYFQTETPDVAAILRVYDKIDVEFTDNDYTYECEDSCDDWGYTWSGIIGSITQSHVHLCMNKVRDKGTNCIASTIVHEMSHRYAGTDDEKYCNFCDEKVCPDTLSVEDALDNADSYSSFAYKLYSLTLLTD